MPKTATATTPSRTAKARTTTSPADALDIEKQALLALEGKGEDVHWDMGVRFNNIVDGKLAEKAGYTNSIEFFNKEISFAPPSTLALYGTVAKNYPRPVAEAYGVTKLGHLLAYEKLTQRTHTATDPALIVVQVPDKKGTLVAKKFSSCSASDLTEALKHLRGKAAQPLPPADVQKKKSAEAALVSVVGAHSSAEVVVQMRGREAVYDLKGLPSSQFDAIMAAMAARAP